MYYIVLKGKCKNISIPYSQNGQILRLKLTKDLLKRKDLEILEFKNLNRKIDNLNLALSVENFLQ